MNTFNREELVQTLFEESGDALFLFDPDSEQLLDVNPTVQRLSGFTRQELLRMSVTYFFRSETRNRLNYLRQAFRKTGVFHSQEDFLMRTKQEGVWIPLNLTVTRLHVRPKTLGLITARDIREQWQAQAHLQASEAKYRVLAENLEQSIFLKDSALRFQAGNRRFCEGLGLAEAELIGKTDADFYPAALAAKYQADDRQVLAESKTLELEEQNLLRGQLHTVRVVKSPVKNAQDKVVGVLGIFWDVTKQRALEEQLRQAQKMEAVGQLAGGIAHDFNNLLTVILGNVQLLRGSLPPGHASLELLTATETAARRAADLTGKMLGFSRRTILRLEPVNVNDTIEETLALLRRTIDPRIQLRTRLAPNLGLVRADPNQLHQVLVNLCLNARDAMPKGGTLQLETENLVLDGPAVANQLEARSGTFIHLRVQDTGTGIAPETMSRIFEPFFTTKKPGQGTGLGLAMVFGIVKQHLGWIDCASTVGQGTTFDIFLPCYQAAPAAHAEPDREPTDHLPCQGHEKILLVDDEAMIRNLAQVILQQQGYRVHLAANGLDALELYQREPGGFDLVILDLTMPGLSGRDTYRQLVHVDPAVQVLFASGYSADRVPGAGSDEEHVLGFVPKPYNPTDLVQAVRTALDHQGVAI